jgi:hypothetical protein
MHRPGVAFPDTLQGPCAGVGLLELLPLTPCPTRRTSRTPAGPMGPRELARLPGPPGYIRGASEATLNEGTTGGKASNGAGLAPLVQHPKGISPAEEPPEALTMALPGCPDRRC